MTGPIDTTNAEEARIRNLPYEAFILAVQNDALAHVAKLIAEKSESKDVPT